MNTPDPYASRREAAARIQAKQTDRRAKLAKLADDVGPAVGKVVSLLASLSPGVAGVSIRLLLGAADAVKDRFATKAAEALKAEVEALKKAVEVLEALDSDKD